MERLSTILEGVEVTSKVPFDLPVQSICADSRHIWPGSMFVALQGIVEDGSRFIPEAVRRGAAVILSNGHGEYPHPNTAVVRVKDSRRALSRIAANFFEHPSRQLTVVGITGTNGKTTTSFLLRSILEANGLKTGLIGTLGIKAPGMEADSILTTPDIIDLHKTLKLFLDSGITHVVMEVSSHALELNRVADVDFDVAIFTNLGQDHLDFHVTTECYFKAKSKLFSALPSDSMAILNGSDRRFESLKSLTEAKVISYSVQGDWNVTFQSWGMTTGGIVGTVSMDGRKIDIESPLFGLHNLENILSAVGAAAALGIPTEVIEKGVTACRSVPGRMERLTTKNGATVMVDYAHTPDAYHKLFSSLRSLLPGKGRLWVIFGCGGDRDEEKRPLMAAAAETYAHSIFVTPDNRRTESLDRINAHIKSGFRKKTHKLYDDRVQAIYDAIRQLKSSDILAIVGKGREDCQIVGTEKIPHSDVDTVRKAISEGQ